MFFANLLFAQIITVKSNQNQQVVDNVIVINPIGEVIGVTDLDGKVDLTDWLNEEYLVLQNPNIVSDVFYINQITDGVIWVETFDNEVILDEAVLKSSQKDYYVLEGYFYAFVLNEREFNIYVDGIMQFVYDRKTNKFKERIIKEYRTFLLENVNENRKEVSTMVFDYYLELPNLKDLREIEKSANKIVKYNEEIDETLFEDTKTALEEKEFRLFGYVFTDMKEVITADFWGKEEMNPKKLINYKHNFTLHLKHKKEGEFSALNVVSNFHPTAMMHLNRKELEKGVRFRRTKSDYKTEYWLDNSSANLYQYLKNTFKSNFVEQPNQTQ